MAYDATSERKRYEDIMSMIPAYKQSDRVNEAYDRLTEAENDIKDRGEYKGGYADSVDKAVSDYLGRDKFNYNPNSDSTYQQLRNRYLDDGKTAMRDTLANGMLNTGGNNNSSAQVAAQQVYNNYASKAADIVPSLEQNAYSRYRAEGADMLDKVNLMKTLDESEYQRYRDDYNNRMNFLGYLSNKYGTLENIDAAAYQREWNNFQYANSMAYQQGRDEVSDNQWQQSFDQSKNQWQQSFDQSKNQWQQSFDQSNKSNAESLLLNMAQLGLTPTKEQLNAGGIDKATYQQWVKKIEDTQSKSVSSGGSGGSSGSSATQKQGSMSNYNKAVEEYEAAGGKESGTRILDQWVSYGWISEDQRNDIIYNAEMKRLSEEREKMIAAGRARRAK